MSEKKFTLSNPKDLLVNPYAKPAFGTTNLGLISFNPDDKIGLKTTNPVFELKTSTGNNFNFPKSQAMKDFDTMQKIRSRTSTPSDEEVKSDNSWWSKRSKTQKIGIVTGSIIATVAIIFFVHKAIKK
jgi:hypothetical protein